MESCRRGGSDARNPGQRFGYTVVLRPLRYDRQIAIDREIDLVAVPAIRIDDGRARHMRIILLKRNAPKAYRDEGSSLLPRR
jgi:urease beta subunit